MTGTSGITMLCCLGFIGSGFSLPDFGNFQPFIMLFAFLKAGLIGLAILWVLSFISSEISLFKRFLEKRRYQEIRKRFSGYKYRDKYR